MVERGYIPLLIIFAILLYTQYRNKILWLTRFIQSKKGTTDMEELAKRFIGCECVLSTFNSQLTGFIKEVADGAVLIEHDDKPEVVNLEFVIRIREYPKTKSGKKKSVIWD